MYRIVLTGPAGGHDLLRRAAQAVAGPGQVCTSVQPHSRKAHRHNLNSTSDFLCPAAQVNRTPITYQEHHIKDTLRRDEEDEEDAWSRKKRMT